MNKRKIDKEFSNILGFKGRIVSNSKTEYKKKYPNNVVVFNANILAQFPGESPKKVWFGDIDLTFQEEDLKKISKVIGATLYVLPEMAARFSTENNPNMDHFVYSTDGNIGDKYYGQGKIKRAFNGTLFLKN